jgi:hypothetical protein
MPAEEQVKLVDKLIDNDEIKNILLLLPTIATSTTTSAAGTKQGKQEEEEQHAKVSTIVSNRY